MGRCLSHLPALTVLSLRGCTVTDAKVGTRQGQQDSARSTSSGFGTNQQLVKLDFEGSATFETLNSLLDHLPSSLVDLSLVVSYKSGLVHPRSQSLSTRLKSIAHQLLSFRYDDHRNYFQLEPSFFKLLVSVRYLTMSASAFEISARPLADCERLEQLAITITQGDYTWQWMLAELPWVLDQSPSLERVYLPALVWNASRGGPTVSIEAAAARRAVQLVIT